MTRRVVRILFRSVALIGCGLAVGWWLNRPDGSSPSPAAAALGRVVGTVRFREAPLEQVLRECERVAGVTIAVDWDAMAAAGATRATPVTLHRYGDTVRQVLARIVGQFPSDDFGVWVTEDWDRIVLGGRDELHRRCVVRDYDVADLLRNASWLDDLSERVYRGGMAGQGNSEGPPTDPYLRRRDGLVEIVIETIDPDSWTTNGGSVGDVRYAGDRLVVTQTVENQRWFTTLLDQLREAEAETTIWPGPWEEDASGRALLARRAPGDVTLDDVPFDRALDHLRETFRVNIELSEHLTRPVEDYEDREVIDPSRRVTLHLTRPTLEDAVVRLGGAVFPSGEAAGVAHDGGNGLILCPAGAAERWSSTEVYDLRPLLGTQPGDDAFDGLLSRMKAEVARKSWRTHGGNVGAARQGYKGQVMVTQTRENHHLLREWLDARLVEARTRLEKK